MRKQFVVTMEEVGGKDPNLVAVLGDISVFGMRNFQKKFPDRFYNIGICEQAMVSLSAGLAEQGWIPVVHTIAPFLVERAYEQIKTDLCYQKLGANLVTVGSAFDYTPDGPTHHCWSDFGVLRVLPGIELISPGSTLEFDELFKQTYNNGHPTYIRLSTAQHGVDIPREKIKFGKACIIKEGQQATVFVTGPRLKNVMEAVASSSVEVVYLPTIKPLDVEAVRLSAGKTKRVLCVEEHTIINGLGAAIAEVIEDMPGVTMKRVGVPHRFVSDYGTYEENLEKMGLDTKGVSQALHQLL